MERNEKVSPTVLGEERVIKTASAPDAINGRLYQRKHLNNLAERPVLIVS